MKKTGCASCGKAMKKMELGGSTKKVLKKSNVNLYGIPQENMGTSSQYGFAKKGGSTLAVCKNGMVRMPDGSCGKRKAPIFKSGGFKDLSGDGKITKKDVLIGRGVIKKPIKKK
jgi:hypothetical protein